MFFIPLSIPLIQNLGIVILQARNQMKFRSVLYIIIALCSLGLSVLLAQKYSGYGCAFATGLALFVGQGIIMNVYYQRSQNINIKKFWFEIMKMSIVPCLFTLVGLFLSSFLNLTIMSIYQFIVGIILYTSLYIPLFIILGMNKEERNLLFNPIQTYIKRQR